MKIIKEQKGVMTFTKSGEMIAKNNQKLFEELLIGEQVEGTAHPRIMKASESMLPWPQLRAFLAELDSACFRFDHEQIRSLLLSMPTGFNPTDGICDLVWQAKTLCSMSRA